MIRKYKRFTIIEQVSNGDLCNLRTIQLFPIDQIGEYLQEEKFRDLFKIYTDGVPKRTKRSPRKKFTLCNVDTLESIINNIGTFPISWRGKIIVFFGTKYTDGVMSFFPVLDLTNIRRKQREDIPALRRIDSFLYMGLSKAFYAAVY